MPEPTYEPPNAPQPHHSSVASASRAVRRVAGSRSTVAREPLSARPTAARVCSQAVQAAEPRLT
jgi:hypothetical protein